MPAKRLINYEYLLRLMREHPGWTMNEYADALTEDARREDPTLARISPGSVAAAISRYRDTWEEDGQFVRPKKAGQRLLPWVNIPEAHWMDTPLRRLRVLDRLARGEQVGDPKAVRWALKFERTLRDRGQVVDLTPQGRPVIRPARADEVDGTGELLTLYARHPGLTDRQWRSMTPDERADAAARWLPPQPKAARA